MTLRALLDQPRAACADRLDLVDATFSGIAGRAAAAKELEERYCATCPIVGACFAIGMEQVPYAGNPGMALGVFAGTSSVDRQQARERAAA